MRKPYDEYDDDDGHTIVDMSQVPHTAGMLFGSRPQKKQAPAPSVPARPWEADDPTGMERLMAVLGALKAGLLVGLFYIVGLGVVLLLMLLFWN